MKNTHSTGMPAILGLLAIALAGSAHAEDGLRWQKDKNKITAHVNWCEVKKLGDCGTPPSEWSADMPRIDSESTVTVEVSHFNFLYYNIDYTIEEKQIEAYAYLAKLWDQLLGFDLGRQIGGVAGLAPGTPAANWWKKVRETREALKGTIAPYAKSPGLTEQQLRDLEGQRAAYLQVVKDLDDLRNAAFAAAATVDDLQRFDIVDKDHATLVEGITTFADLAQRSRNGDRKSVGKKAAGTYVTVTVNPKPLPATTNTRDLGSVSVEYLSESKYPLMFHAGLTYNTLKDAKFETVRALQGRDLFTKVRDEKGTETFSAYLSYPLGNESVDKARWFATLGTDLKDVGDNIYVGLSARIKSRWILSVGGVYGREKEGEGKTTDTGQSGTDARTLYEIVKEKRKWGGFASISVKIY
jgi:hypothetical protein